MPVTADKPAPYAPTASIIDVMTRNRERGLPTPVNAETLGRIGVPDSLSSRVLYALISLDLIDENDRSFGCDAELVLGVDEDEAVRGGALLAEGEEGEGFG